MPFLIEPTHYRATRTPRARGSSRSMVGPSERLGSSRLELTRSGGQLHLRPRAPRLDRSVTNCPLNPKRGGRGAGGLLAGAIALTGACSPVVSDGIGGSGGTGPQASGGTGENASGGQPPGSGGTGGTVGTGGAAPAGGAPSTGGLSAAGGSGGTLGGSGGLAQTGGTSTGGGAGGDFARIEAFCDAYCAARDSVSECTSPYDTCLTQCPLTWIDRHEDCPAEVMAMVGCAEETPGSLDWSCSGGMAVAADYSCESSTQAVSDCLNP